MGIVDLISLEIRLAVVLLMVLAAVLLGSVGMGPLTVLKTLATLVHVLRYKDRVMNGKKTGISKTAYRRIMDCMVDN